MGTNFHELKGSLLVSSQIVGESGVFFAGEARTKHPTPHFIEKLLFIRVICGQAKGRKCVDKASSLDGGLLEDWPYFTCL